MSHTKEPWILLPVGRDESFIFQQGTTNTIIDHGINTETARRIVACVNACAGISTEELESTSIPVYWQSVALKLERTQEQRDELKAAIEQYVTMPAFDGTQETSKIRLAAKYRLAAARKEKGK